MVRLARTGVELDRPSGHLPVFPGLGPPGGIAAPYKAGSRPDAPLAAPVLLADGSVRILPSTVTPQVLDALLSSARQEGSSVAIRG